MPIVNEQIRDIAQTIIDATGLAHVDIDQLDEDTMLSDGPLELDSIDILEVVAAIEDKYKVKVSDAQEGANYFQSLKTIHNFIQEKK